MDEFSGRLPCWDKNAVRVCAHLLVRWEPHELGRASIDWGEEENARIVRGNTRVRRCVCTVVFVYVCYVASSSCDLLET